MIKRDFASKGILVKYKKVYIVLKVIDKNQKIIYYYSRTGNLFLGMAALL
jgi:hypothetical protein